MVRLPLLHDPPFLAPLAFDDPKPKPQGYSHSIMAAPKWPERLADHKVPQDDNPIMGLNYWA